MTRLRKVTWPAVRWKLRQKYSQFRSIVGGGRFIWNLEPNVRFVARTGDAFSHVLFVCRGHETVELQWCRQWLRPGESVIDCGANIGFFSAYLAQAMSLERILAVEGNHRTAMICAKNLSLLGIHNVTVVEAILSADLSDKLAIPDVPEREPWQRAVRVDGNLATAVTTLDQLVETYRINPSLVKIDCEGYEPFILGGGTALMKIQRPAFMIECNDVSLRAAGTNRNELFRILREHDYQTFHLASFGSSHPFGVRCDETFPADEFNFAAIPGTASALERWRISSGDLNQP